MSGATTDDLYSWVKKMMTSLNINDYKLNIGGNTTKGDGYLGEVTFLTVDTSKNGSKKNYDLVIKSAKKSEELRKQTPIKEAYDREIFFYNKIFPLLDEFQREKRIEKPFVNVPKCYCVSDEPLKEVVILQNLKSMGYQLHDRQKPMNLNHILMVFRTYGKFHALSLAFRHKKPAMFKTITKNLSDVFGLFIVKGQMFDLFKTSFADLRKILEKAKESEVLKKLDGFEKDFEEILINFSDEKTDPSLLIHGDCWNNNFMFKYEGSDITKPVDMQILDFQLLRVGSPIIDLSYFLYTCADKNVLKDFDFILQAYHSSLSDFLCDLGCDQEILFPYKKLKEQWKNYGRYGMVIALFLLKITLCDSNEAPDLMDSVEKGQNLNESFGIKIQNEDIYNQRIKDIYIHFANAFL